MTSNLGLVDTNVLVYAVYPAVPQHAPSRALLDQARQLAAGLCVAPQNVAEFYATVTNPRRVTQVKSTTEALDAWVDAAGGAPGHRDTFDTAPPTAPRAGTGDLGVQLVATMLGNGVTTIYAHNTADFQGFPGTQVLTP